MKTKESQNGATLVVALIFLVLMSLFALSAFNSSSSNLRIVGNSQAFQESLSAAQMAVEATISTPEFHKNPDGVAQSPVTVDMNGDGTPDYTAWLKPAPSCYRAKPILPSELPAAPKNAATTDIWAPCRPPVRSGGTFVDSDALVSGADPESCANSEWNVRAEVKDAATNTQVSVNQGVAVIVFGNEVSSYCE
ncbi:pilus assembly PilX family protein [Simplicispira lacusdiani]|uniref:pilus assembly PilX family protein n=1 Tax=Simplicispira lacusdiani TaxID=2213010 RepID=UPI000E70FFBB|nr:PilX N-terminal domain-containing pilus assembly protein [Simplicispira lacusdiani]